MQRLAEVEQQFVNELTTLYDIDEARQLYLLLLEDLFGWSRQDYMLRKQTSIDDQQTARLRNALTSLKKAEPIQYLLGYAWFMGMKLAVNQSVLIPRPETEELVQHVATRQQSAHRIIDIGTGSGCIALALKRMLPTVEMYALDVSADALNVAKQNAINQRISVEYIQADILEWDVIFQPDFRFDAVVSNPPYITDREQRDMHPNVLAYEPHLALFVDDHTPLLFYDHIASFAWQHLRPGGGLYFEINRNYGTAVTNLLAKKGYREIQLLQDLHGADRIVHAKK